MDDIRDGDPYGRRLDGGLGDWDAEVRRMREKLAIARACNAVARSEDIAREIAKLNAQVDELEAQLRLRRGQA